MSKIKSRNKIFLFAVIIFLCLVAAGVSCKVIWEYFPKYRPIVEFFTVTATILPKYADGFVISDGKKCKAVFYKGKSTYRLGVKNSVNEKCLIVVWNDESKNYNNIFKIGKDWVGLPFPAGGELAIGRWLILPEGGYETYDLRWSPPEKGEEKEDPEAYSIESGKDTIIFRIPATEHQKNEIIFSVDKKYFEE